MKHKYNEGDLWDSILSTHEITCSACGDTRMVYNIDEYDAISLFHKEGWRVTAKSNCYCPKCARKKLKQ